MEATKKNATVYKLVKEREGRLLSGMSFWLHPDWIVEYQPGRWTVPVKEGTALFAYAGYPGFMLQGSDQLWLCTADIVDGELGHGRQVRIIGNFGAARSLAAFWRNPAKYRGQERITGVWCSRIKLVERMA